MRKLSGLECRLVLVVLATVKPEWCLFLYGAQMFHLPNVERVISGRWMSMIWQVTYAMAPLMRG